MVRDKLPFCLGLRTGVRRRKTSSDPDSDQGHDRRQRHTRRRNSLDRDSSTATLLYVGTVVSSRAGAVEGSLPRVLSQG